MEKVTKIKRFIFYFIIFISLFILYSKVSPLMLGDPDDWTYISYHRQAIPIWKAWNPSRILPETFMSLCGDISAFITYPITGDYLKSITITYSVVMALMVVIYLLCFEKVINNLLQLNENMSLFVTFFFMAAHFLIFKTETENNYFMFGSSSLNRLFFYTIPLLLNGICIFYILPFIIRNSVLNIGVGDDSNQTSDDMGALYLLTYLAVFSNIAVNIALVSLIMVSIANDGIQWIRNKRKPQQTGVIYRTYVILLEVIALLFDANGGRSADLQSDFVSNIKITLGQVDELFCSVEKKFAFITLALTLIALYTCIRIYKRERKEDVYQFISFLCICIVCFVISLLYMILLCAKVGIGGRFLHVDTRSVVCLYFVLIAAYSLGVVMQNIGFSKHLIPVLTYIIIFALLNTSSLGGGNDGSLYYACHNNYSSPRSCWESDVDIIEQFLAADRAGLEEFELKAPAAIANYGWAGNRISKTLYRHRIISKPMEVTVVLKQN